MPELLRFKDDDRKGCWANIRMDNGDPCWVSIAQTGVLVKKSREGSFGAKIYAEKNIHEVAKKVAALVQLYPDMVTPPEMLNIVLISFVNAVLHCSSLADVSRVLNEAVES